MLHLIPGVSFGFSSNTCSLPPWLALKRTWPAATEAAAPRDRPEGPAGCRGSRGCTSRRWPREPGQWRSTTPSPSNRAASPLTALCSSSVRITSYGNMPTRSPNGHILYSQSGRPAELLSRLYRGIIQPSSAGMCQLEAHCLPEENSYI